MKKKEIIPNLVFLKKIIPQLRDILFLGDGSPTHQAIEQVIRTDITSRFPEQKFAILANDNLEYLIQQLDIYKKGIIFLTTIGGIKDEYGNIVPLKKSLSSIANSGDFTIISMEDVYLEAGIFGGYVTNGFSQGKAAAELTVRILQGNPPISIPLITESPNQYMFNYPQLKKLGLTISQLPEKSIILNRPHSFYDQYRYRILSVIFFLIFQAIVIVLLNFLANKAGKKLRGSEREYRSTVEGLLVGVVVHDADSHILYSNPEASKIFGLTADQLSGKEVIDPTWMFVNEDSSPMEVEDYPVSKVISNKKPLTNYVLGIIRPDKVYVTWVNVNASPLFFADDKLEKVIVNFMDITDRKQALKSLRKSEELLRSTQELTKVGGWEWNIEKQTMSWTDEAYRIHDFQPDQFNSGTTEHVEASLKCYDPEDVPTIQDAFQKCSEKGIEYDLEFPLTTAKGRRIWVRTVTKPILNNGKVVKVIGNIIDITDYKRLEKELRQAQKMESIGKLAGGIAHDFNNILFPIMGFTQMSMEDLPKDHPVQEYLQDVLDGSKRASDLVKRILLFSRKQDQTFEPTSLKPVIEETLKLLRSSIPASINIQSNLCENDDCVLCDATQIHEVVMNLCINSYHALEDHGGEIKVELNETQPDSSLNLPPGEYVCLSIADNGSGIPEDILDKIFEPYFTTKEIGKGSGLGLSVVHGIVKNYKGEISVKSILGKGSTFEIFLPVTTLEEELEDKQKDKQIDHGNETVLFVDDEQTIVKLGVKSLERLGYNVTGMHDSMKALNLVVSDPERFDLVITDMAMPKMEGLELSKKIHEINPDIPVIICSGYSEKLDKANIKIPNIKTIIDKPILIENLTKKVREILDSNIEDHR